MIEIKDLKYKWPGQQDWLLDIPNLCIDNGQKLFVTGASGSGKTTLLNLLGGVILPHDGMISMLDTELTQLKATKRDAFRADHMGYIFQQFNLVPYLSVLENVLLPCWFSEVRMARCIQKEKTPADEAIRLLHHLGIGGSSDINKPVTELSVGQQQRVAAARALIGSPEVVIADEPASALDDLARQAFIQLLFEECEAKKTTLVYVSHDTGLKNMFDDVIQINGPDSKTAQVSGRGGEA